MRKLYVDVTATLASGLRSGIQRVVRKLVEELSRLDDGAAVAVPVVAIDGRFHALTVEGVQVMLHPRAVGSQWAAGSRTQKRIGAIVAAIPSVADRLQRWNVNRRIRAMLLLHAMAEPVAFGPGTTAVMLDAFWGGTTSIVAAERARRAGASVALIVHDLIPITHPDTMDRMTATLFQRRLLRAAKAADIVLAISKHCAGQVGALLGPGARPRVESFELGSDIGGARAPAPGKPSQSSYGYLMVGTVEPRKGHRVVLDAFEAMWTQGLTPRLAIVGRVGWADVNLVARLRQHPELGRRLRLSEDVSDAELAGLMAEADALIMASSAEGFGLPIVEGLAVGLPAIVSDIAVFREIAGDAALYFDHTDPASLVGAVRSFEQAPEHWRAKAAGFRWVDWRTAALRFRAKLIGEAMAA